MTNDFAPGRLSRRHFMVLAGGTTGAALTGGLGPATPAVAADLADDATWTGATTVFADDCSSLVMAGWARTRTAGTTTRPAAVDSGHPVPGGYVMDQWQNGAVTGGGGWAIPGTSPASANPWQIAPRGSRASAGQVAANTYHLYADGHAGAEQSYVLMSTNPATTSLDVGPGAWRVDLRLRIHDLPVANDFRHTRGFLLQFVLHGHLHSFTLVDHDQLLAATGGGGIGYWRTLPMPDATSFHDWSFVFDGVDTTLVCVDGAVVGRFRGTNVPSTAAAQLKLWAHTQSGVVGTVDVEIAGITVRSLGNGVPIASLADWTISTTSGATAVEDTGVIGLSAPAGSAVIATQSAPLGSQGWTLRLSARVLELGAGATLDVQAGGHWLQLRSDRSAVLLGSSATDVLQTFPAAFEVSDDATFGVWTLGVDAAGRFHLEYGGSALIAGAVNLGSSAAAASVSITANAAGTGAARAELARLSLARATTTAWYEPSVHLSVRPSAARDGVPIVAHIADADPADLAAQALQLTVTFTNPATGATVATWTATPAGPDVEHVVTGFAGAPALLEHHVSLSRGVEVLTRSDGLLHLPTTSVPAAAGTTLTTTPGQAALFTDIAGCATASGTAAGSAGWELGSWTYEGTTVGGTVLDSGPAAEPIIVPVTCTGWTAVHVGYVSGCEAFTVTLGTRPARTIEIPLPQGYEAGERYGSRGLGEVCVSVADHTGEQLTIGAVAGRGARIAYVRFVALTATEQALAAQPNTPTAKAVHYNNDGYSGFYTGWYGSVETRPVGNPQEDHGLKKDVVDVYADHPEVSGLSFTSGTMLYRFDGGPVGEPYGGLDPATGQPPGAAAYVKDENGVPTNLLRDGDKVALDAIRAFRQQGVSPLAEVAEHASGLVGSGRLQGGFGTYTSLRMNVLYPQTTYPFLNGPYNQFPVWTNPRRQHVFDLWRAPNPIQASRLSYADPALRQRLVDQLVHEVSLSPDVAGVELDFGRYPDALGFEPVTQTAWNPLPVGGWLESDLDPATGNLTISGNTSVAFDYKRRSVGLDLGTARGITTIVLSGSGTSTRLVPGDLRVWRSDTNSSDWTEVTGWTGSKTGAVITLTHSSGVTARYLKVSQPYADTAYTMANPLQSLVTVGPALRDEQDLRQAYLADAEQVLTFRAGLVTALLTALRAALGTRKIIVRVPHGSTTLPGRPDPVRTAWVLGYDVEAWVQASPRPLVDVLVPTNVSTETFWQGLDRWRALVAGTPVKVYGGTSGTLGGSDPSRSDEEAANRGFARSSGHTAMDSTMYRERALDFYRAGLDGIYLFNAWNGRESLGRDLGDPVALEKWHLFDRPLQARTGLIDVDAVSGSSWADVAQLVASLQEQGQVAPTDGARLHGLATASGHLGRGDSRARQRLYENFNRAIASAEAARRLAEPTVRRLNAAAYRAFHRG